MRPEYGHVDTTRNRAAPEVELALIAIDFIGRRGLFTASGRSSRSMHEASGAFKNVLLNQAAFWVRAKFCL
ncbi:hypothetical protein DIE03_19840 [Burkholderia sp. Bp8992]|nr:hypothetical protein DIE03_19840 [Burkholderia sp. Bp8992]